MEIKWFLITWKDAHCSNRGDGPKGAVPAILIQLYVRTAGAGAEGVVSIGNKGLARSGNFTPEFGLLSQLLAMIFLYASWPGFQCGSHTVFCRHGCEER